MVAQTMGLSTRVGVTANQLNPTLVIFRNKSNHKQVYTCYAVLSVFMTLHKFLSRLYFCNEVHKVPVSLKKKSYVILVKILM